MLSTSQPSFDFNRPQEALTAQPFRTVPECSSNDSGQDLEGKLIGSSRVIRSLRRAIQMVAASSETVLITGESGTGKELIARGIHDLGPRRNKSFVGINCGALNESLLESELFGHVKGAFTGATTNKKGFFEAASGGTVFLDEFAEMSLAMQQRLLRVLQEGTVRPVGSTDSKEIEIDTRIVVATHHDLKRDIAEGKFREDLYYRVNVLLIDSPALRDRPEDISALALHFLRKYNDRNSSTVSEAIPSNVLCVLETYSWPGNVRELENIIKRLALCASNEGAINAAHLRSVSEFEHLRSFQFTVSKEASKLDHISRKMNFLSRKRKESEAGQHSAELDHYCSLLDQTSGNLSEAARRLNIKRTTLRKRIISLQKKCSNG